MPHYKILSGWKYDSHASLTGSKVVTSTFIQQVSKATQAHISHCRSTTSLTAAVALATVSPRRRKFCLFLLLFGFLSSACECAKKQGEYSQFFNLHSFVLYISGCSLTSNLRQGSCSWASGQLAQALTVLWDFFGQSSILNISILNLSSSFSSPVSLLEHCGTSLAKASWSRLGGAVGGWVLSATSVASLSPLSPLYLSLSPLSLFYLSLSPLKPVLSQLVSS